VTHFAVLVFLRGLRKTTNTLGGFEYYVSQTGSGSYDHPAATFICQSDSFSE
jgi:hypothetical protein